MSKYTVIGIARWVDNGSGKLNGDVILDGEITAQQLAELKAALPDESFVPTDLEDALGVEVEDCSGERVYTYLRDTPAEHHSTRHPGWDEITIDLTDSGVSIDAFIAAVREASQAAPTPAGVPTYTYEQVSEAVNRGANDVITEGDLDGGVVDAINFAVTAALTYLANPGGTILDAVADYSDEIIDGEEIEIDEDETYEEAKARTKLAAIVGWMTTSH